MIFIWDERNHKHVGRHGVSRQEAEFVVDHAQSPFPRRIEGDKRMVRGQTGAGRWVQVIYVDMAPERVDVMKLDLEDRIALEQDEQIVYIIHARDLTRREKTQYRRNRTP